MSEFSVRAAAAGDVAGVIALERMTAEAPHWGESEYVAAMDGCGEYVRRRLVVAEADGTLIGFAVGKVAGDLAELESVAVDVRMRRGGVGKALCAAVIAWCREERAATMELEVRSASAEAIELYQGLGFVPVGKRPRYYSEPVGDAVLMRLDL